jgi:hypothetical protein
MASVPTLIRTDDLNGKAAHHTRVFEYDGKTYQIDLDNLNAGNFDRAMERVEKIMSRYVEVATEVTPKGKASKGKASKAAGNSEAGKVRAWAQAQGLAVGARGRIPAEVTEAYRAANPEA